MSALPSWKVALVTFIIALLAIWAVSRFRFLSNLMNVGA